MRQDVDRLLRRRRLAVRATALALVMVGYLVVAGSSRIAAGAGRRVEVVATVVFCAAAIVLALRATTAFGGRRQSPQLNDELTASNRAQAAQAGYLVLMFGIVATFLAGLTSELRLEQAAPALLWIGAAAAALRFATLEARGDED